MWRNESLHTPVSHLLVLILLAACQPSGPDVEPVPGYYEGTARVRFDVDENRVMSNFRIDVPTISGSCSLSSNKDIQVRRDGTFAVGEGIRGWFTSPTEVAGEHPSSVDCLNLMLGTIEKITTAGGGAWHAQLVQAAIPLTTPPAKATATVRVAPTRTPALPTTPPTHAASVGTAPPTTEPYADRITAVAFSPNGNIIVTGNAKGLVELWNAADGSHRRSLEPHMGEVTAVVLAPDGNWMATAAGEPAKRAETSIRIWDTYSLKVTGNIDTGTPVSSLAVSPAGTLLASGSSDGLVDLWHVPEGVLEEHLAGHAERVPGLAFSDDGEWLASASWDNTIRIWNLTDSSPAQIISAPGSRRDHFQNLAFVEGAESVVAFRESPDPAVLTWSLPEGEAGQGTKMPATDYVWFSPDGSLSASMARTDIWFGKGKLKLRSTTDGAVTAILQDIPLVRTLAFSPDGTAIAVGSYDGMLYVIPLKR